MEIILQSRCYIYVPHICYLPAFEFYFPSNLFIYSANFDVSWEGGVSLDNRATVSWMLISAWSAGWRGDRIWNEESGVLMLEIFSLSLTAASRVSPVTGGEEGCSFRPSWEYNWLLTRTTQYSNTQILLGIHYRLPSTQTFVSESIKSSIATLRTL